MTDLDDVLEFKYVRLLKAVDETVVNKNDPISNDLMTTQLRKVGCDEETR